jgi:acetone carboxylase gamma subunit
MHTHPFAQEPQKLINISKINAYFDSTLKLPVQSHLFALNKEEAKYLMHKCHDGLSNHSHALTSNNRWKIKERKK